MTSKKINQTAKPNLSKVVRVRMTEYDLDKLREQAQAEGVSMSDWLRLRIENGQFKHAKPTNRGTPEKAKNRARPYHPADPDLITQLAKIGNNLNQIAHIANSQKSLPTLLQLASIERALMELLSNAH